MGLARARIEDITRQAGLSKGAFYLHFEDKESLFQELLDGMMLKLGSNITARESAVTAFLEGQPLTARDVHERSPAHEALLKLECRFDREVLELMWQERAVFSVLIRGSSGTRFDGMAWEVADAEVRRLEEAYGRMQKLGACRDDLPPEVFGSLVVGTYFLLAERMTRMKTPPDFEKWVGAIQRLIREGSAPLAVRAPAGKARVRSRRARATNASNAHSGGRR